MYNDHQIPDDRDQRSGRQGPESVRGMLMHEAAEAILTAGRDLADDRPKSVREFLRGPALTVGIALTVMGMTMWISEFNQRPRQAAQASSKRKARASQAHRRSTDPAREDAGRGGGSAL